MAVNRHITGTAHQGGGNLTAGIIPTTTLEISYVYPGLHAGGQHAVYYYPCQRIDPTYFILVLVWVVP